MSNVKDKELQKSDDLSRAVQNFLSSKEFWIFFEHPLYLHMHFRVKIMSRDILKYVIPLNVWQLKKIITLLDIMFFFFNLFRVLLHLDMIWIFIFKEPKKNFNNNLVDSILNDCKFLVRT